MDELNALEQLGITMPSPAYLLGVIVFSIIGYAAYRHGKNRPDATTKWIGIALMLYPYAVSETWLMYAVGAALCLWLYLSRRH